MAGGGGGGGASAEGADGGSMGWESALAANGSLSAAQRGFFRKILTRRSQQHHEAASSASVAPSASGGGDEEALSLLSVSPRQTLQQLTAQPAYLDHRTINRLTTLLPQELSKWAKTVKWVIAPIGGIGSGFLAVVPAGLYPIVVNGFNAESLFSCIGTWAVYGSLASGFAVQTVNKGLREPEVYKTIAKHALGFGCRFSHEGRERGPIKLAVGLIGGFPLVVCCAATYFTPFTQFNQTLTDPRTPPWLRWLIHGNVYFPLTAPNTNLQLGFPIFNGKLVDRVISWIESDPKRYRLLNLIELLDFDMRKIAYEAPAIFCEYAEMICNSQLTLGKRLDAVASLLTEFFAIERRGYRPKSLVDLIQKDPRAWTKGAIGKKLFQGLWVLAAVWSAVLPGMLVAGNTHVFEWQKEAVDGVLRLFGKEVPEEVITANIRQGIEYAAGVGNMPLATASGIGGAKLCQRVWYEGLDGFFRHRLSGQNLNYLVGGTGILASFALIFATVAQAQRNPFPAFLGGNAVGIPLIFVTGPALATITAADAANIFVGIRHERQVSHIYENWRNGEQLSEEDFRALACKRFVPMVFAALQGLTAEVLRIPTHDLDEVTISIINEQLTAGQEEARGKWRYSFCAPAGAGAGSDDAGARAGGDADDEGSGNDARASGSKPWWKCW